MDFDPTRSPGVDGLQIIDDKGNQVIAGLNVLEFERFGNVSAAYQEEFSIKAKSHRSDIWL